MPLDNTTKLWMYEKMAKHRYFENEMKKVYMEGKTPKFDLAKGIFPGEFHVSSGQEPCAVGVLPHLTDDDWCGASHRSHHIAIARGVDGFKMTAEMFGKKDGLCGGYGGHIHLFDKSKKFSTSGIIGEGIAITVGAALAFKKRGQPHVAVGFIGDGAMNQGVVHEALNLASVWKLPLVIVIEDNGWAVSVPTDLSSAVKNYGERAAGYGMPTMLVENNCPYDIHAAAGEAIANARNGKGPTLLELKTLRLEGHFMGDAQQYRGANELQYQSTEDPLPRLRKRLIDEAVRDETTLAQLDKDIAAEVDGWITFARECEYPAPEDALLMNFSA